MRNDSGSFDRLWRLETQVNNLVLRGARDPDEVATLLQFINDDPNFWKKFMNPTGKADFTVVDELDLEVNYSLTPDEVFAHLLEGTRYIGKNNRYTGQRPEPGIRTVRLVIGELARGVKRFPEGYRPPGAWPAVAYIKARPKWDRKLKAITFNPDETTAWAEHGDAMPCSVIMVDKPERGPWVNKCQLCVAADTQHIALIRE